MIKTELTLEEAREHCADPETSSRGTGVAAISYTELWGDWFDAYEEE